MWKRTVVFVMFLLAAAPLVRGQLVEDYRFKGKVVDTKGNGIAKARIVFKETATGKELAFGAKADGTFDCRMIPHNDYDVSFSADGYETRKEHFAWSGYSMEGTVTKEANVILRSEVEAARGDLSKKAAKLYQEAYEALAARDWAKAQSKAQELVREGAGPFEYAARFVLARASMELGAIDAAIEEYRKALALKADLFEAHYDLATLLERKGVHEEAIAEYKKASELRPEDAEVYYNIGAVLVNSRFFDAAKPYLEKAVGLDPNHSQANKALGFVYFGAEEKDFAKGAECLKKYLELEPNAADAEQIKKILEELKQVQP